MAIDPRIALGVQAPAINTPFESLGQILALQRQQQAMQASQAQEEARRQDIAKQAREEAEQARYDQQLKTIGNPGFTREVFLKNVSDTAPHHYAAAVKMFDEQDKDAEALKKVKADTASAKAQELLHMQRYTANSAGRVKALNYSPAALELMLKENEGHFEEFKPQAAQIRQQVLQGTPVKDIIDGLIRQSSEVQGADTSATSAAAELPGKVASSQIQQQVAANMKGGLTADQQRQATQAQATGAETARHNRVEEGLAARRLANEDVAPTLTPEARRMTAHQYAMTGQLPPMGMGKAGAAVRTAIINEAADIYKNLDLPTQMAAYQANKSSLVKVQQSRDAVGAFEQTALKNADQFLETAKKVLDTGSPWLNKPLRSVSNSVLGSTDQAAFNTARQAVVPEFAKLLGNPSLSGQLTDSQRHEVDTILSPDATLKQIYESLRILRNDAKNRTDSLDQQIKDIQQRIANPPAGTTPAAAGGPKVGDIVSVKGQRVKITAIHPDGSFDGEPVK